MDACVDLVHAHPLCMCICCCFAFGGGGGGGGGGVCVCVCVCVCVGCRCLWWLHFWSVRREPDRRVVASPCLAQSNYSAKRQLKAPDVSDLDESTRIQCTLLEYGR